MDLATVSIGVTEVAAAGLIAVTFLVAWKPIQKTVTFFKKGF